MFNKRNLIIGLVILAIVVGLIGNYFFPTEDKTAPPVAEKAEKSPPTHTDIEGIDPYTVADIHALIGDNENTIERILYRARWNLESDTANPKYRDRNKKMRERYQHSLDAKLLRAITLVALHDENVGYNALFDRYER